MLLRALEKSNLEVDLIFLGDGSERSSLVELSMRVPDITKVDFKGRVSRDVAIEHMLEADVSISLSKGEGMPVAVLESMYAGCFLILSTIPPHREVAPPEERCLFVNPDMDIEVVEALKFAVENIHLLQSGRDQSTHYALSTFSVARMLKEYYAVYLKLLDQKS